jgi:hypothetical protein
MCWSFNTSIVTWIIAFATAIYLIQRRKKNDITMGCLVLVYSSMQLWESLMWYDQQCGAVNIAGTKLAYVALWSHILVISIGLYIEYKVTAPIFVGVAMLVLAYILYPDVWKCSVPSPNGHLIWGFDPSFYVLIFSVAIALALYYIRPLKTAALISALFLTSFAVSFMYNRNMKTTGSFWCWICAIFSCVFVFTNLDYKL